MLYSVSHLNQMNERQEIKPLVNFQTALNKIIKSKCVSSAINIWFHCVQHFSKISILLRISCEIVCMCVT